MTTPPNTAVAVLSTAIDATLERCERSLSSSARATLRSLVWARGIRLSNGADCVLSPQADVLRKQEGAKKRLSTSLWRCTLCKKCFSSEHFLDKHLARRHALVRADEGGVCLADLCGIVLPCAPRIAPPVSTHLLRGAPETEYVIKGPSPCHDVRERRARRAACAHAVIKCVGGRNAGADAAQRRAYLERALCDAALKTECARGAARQRALAMAHAVRAPPQKSRSYALGCALACFALGAIVGVALAYALFRARQRAVMRGMRQRAAAARKWRGSAKRRHAAGHTLMTQMHRRAAQSRSR